MVRSASDRHGNRVHCLAGSRLEAAAANASIGRWGTCSLLHILNRNSGGHGAGRPGEAFDAHAQAWLTGFDWGGRQDEWLPASRPPPLGHSEFHQRCVAFATAPADGGIAEVRRLRNPQQQGEEKGWEGGPASGHGVLPDCASRHTPLFFWPVDKVNVCCYRPYCKLN